MGACTSDLANMTFFLAIKRIWNSYFTTAIEFKQVNVSPFFLKALVFYVVPYNHTICCMPCRSEPVLFNCISFDCQKKQQFQKWQEGIKTLGYTRNSQAFQNTSILQES